MRLSILSVLGETFQLWARHWRFFVLLAFFLGFSTILGGDTHRHDDLNIWNVVRGAARTVLPVILQAIGMAASLSLLSNQSAEKTWLVMARGVRRYTGQLVGVQVLLVVIGLLLLIPVGLFFAMLHVVLGFSLLWMVLGEFIFLIFLKYALANPLVVVENLPATQALSVSWRMTRNCFGFVFGCYLFVSVIEWLINFGAHQLEIAAWKSNWSVDLVPWTLIAIKFAATYWYVLPWVMYLRIKAADDQQVEPPASGG